MSSRKVAEQKNKVSRPKPTALRVESMGSGIAADHGDTLAPNPTTSGDVLRLQRTLGNQAVGRVLTQANQTLIQRVMIGTIDVDKEGRMASWVQDGKWYHLNTTTDPMHVTEEGWSVGKKKQNVTKTHYFFRRENFECVNAIGRGGVPGSKKKFSELPRAVRDFVQDHFDELL